MICKKARDTPLLKQKEHDVPSEGKCRTDSLHSQEEPKSTVHVFGAACHYHGKKIQDVIAELMREYAEKVLGKGSKG